LTSLETLTNTYIYIYIVIEKQIVVRMGKKEKFGTKKTVDRSDGKIYKRYFVLKKKNKNEKRSKRFRI